MYIHINEIREIYGALGSAEKSRNVDVPTLKGRRDAGATFTAYTIANRSGIRVGCQVSFTLAARDDR
jgi:hypothetical protein